MEARKKTNDYDDPVQRKKHSFSNLNLNAYDAAARPTDGLEHTNTGANIQREGSSSSSAGKSTIDKDDCIFLSYPSKKNVRRTPSRAVVRRYQNCAFMLGMREQHISVRNKLETLLVLIRSCHSGAFV